MLDVGAATGDMVNIACEMGYQAEGIELSKFAIARAKELYNIDLKQLFLNEIESNSFQIVHLNHVFEHFNDPLTELNHLNRILVDNGILYIEIPYQFHLMERIKYKFFSKPRPFTLHSIHHPYFYTPGTIKSMVINSGFEIIKLNVFSSKRYMETNKNWFKMIFWLIISILGIGNHIELYAKKSTTPKNNK
jgi:SAM-dependent methyltransferase